MNTSVFSSTPDVNILDVRGLLVREIQYYRHPDPSISPETRITRYEYNASGALLHSCDPRLYNLQAGPNSIYQTTLSGAVLKNESVDTGTSVLLCDAAGRPAIAVTATGAVRTWQYEDASLPGRMLSITERASGSSSAACIAERFFWAGTSAIEKENNLAGQCITHYDSAGRVQLRSLSLHGAILSQSRQLLPDDYQANWQGETDATLNIPLVGEVYITQSTVDATGTMLTSTDARGNTRKMSYDIVGQLKASWLTLKGGQEQVIVASLSYSAAGKKLREEHGNGVMTTYTYEPQTQRLLEMKTERLLGHVSGAKVFQDLRYEYDPVGNVLKVTNDAEATRFWSNQKVEPANTYTYDSLYQLVSASGREMANIGHQGTGQLPSVEILPTDNSTFTNYSRAYTYDAGGNLTKITHLSPATKKSYTIAMTVSNRSNRAVMSSQTTDPTQVDALFTAGGQQRQLSSGSNLSWNAQGELDLVQLAADSSESYRYDGHSQRVLKVQKDNNGGRHWVAYLPGLELREITNGGINENLQVICIGEAGRAQVRVLHWNDGICDDQIRYSYDNLTGNSNLELDNTGNIISQEEYYPYGGTAIWMARNAVEADYKTTRYSGKERDITGLYYYGYRYYQPWIGRWLSGDPAETIDGLNLYRMVRNNPVRFCDRQGLWPVGMPDRTDEKEWYFETTDDFKNSNGQDLNKSFADTSISYEEMLKQAVDIGSQVKTLTSFGARDGGFELTMALRHDIYKEIDESDHGAYAKNINNIKVYLDAESARQHPATTYTPAQGSDGLPLELNRMANPFWDIIYKKAVFSAESMVFLITTPWLNSIYCKMEFDWFAEARKQNREIKGLFIVYPEAREGFDILLKTNGQLKDDGNVSQINVKKVDEQRISLIDRPPGLSKDILNYNYSLSNRVTQRIMDFVRQE